MTDLPQIWIHGRAYVGSEEFERLLRERADEERDDQGAWSAYSSVADVLRILRSGSEEQPKERRP